MRARIWLSEPFQKEWGADPFRSAFSVQGETFRKVKTRETLRFFFHGEPCFLKRHKGVGWRETFKNWLMLKRPVYGARNEYDAIRLLERLGVPTMTPLAFAERGFGPYMTSFLVTAELRNKISLEDYCADWRENPPSSAWKNALIRALAETCAAMHFHGLNHRDCYLCHFLLDKEKAAQGVVSLSVMDLHRAEIRDRIPRRMRVKDLAGIFFSAFDLGLGRRDALRFIAAYRRGGPLDGRIWRDVLRTAIRLYRKENCGRFPALPDDCGL